MTLSTPASVHHALPPAPQGRGAAWMLLPAGVVAGLGLGLAALALTRPPAVVEPLPPIAPVAPQPAETALQPAAARAPWPDLFGTRPAPAPAAAPAAEPSDDPPAPLVDGSLILRGLALTGSGDEAFAMIETPEGMSVVRVGDVLPQGYRVLEITAAGVELGLGEAYHLVRFDDNATPPTASAPQSTTPQRPIRPMGEPGVPRDEPSIMLPTPPTPPGIEPSIMLPTFPPITR